MSFKKNKYQIIRNAVSKEVCDIKPILYNYHLTIVEISEPKMYHV